MRSRILIVLATLMVLAGCSGKPAPTKDAGGAPPVSMPPTSPAPSAP